MTDKSSVKTISDEIRMLRTTIGDCPNVELPVNSNAAYWKVIRQRNGWQLQFNVFTGLCRIVDEKGIRRAWGDPVVMAEKFRRLVREEFLEPGDVVGVARKRALNLYEHYGVYLGDGQVIHYAGDGNDFNGRVSVRKSLLEIFLNGDRDYFILYFHENSPTPKKIRVSTSFGLSDTGYDGSIALSGNRGMKLYSPPETVERAQSRLGEEKYNLFSNNCEHFAVWCKTGVSESFQVKKVRTVLLEQGMRH